MQPRPWTFDVTTSSHDDLKLGLVAVRTSRVHLSREDFPSWALAADTAAAFAVALHGGMATRVSPIY